MFVISFPKAGFLAITGLALAILLLMQPVGAARTQATQTDGQSDWRILRTRLRQRRVQANVKRQSKPQPPTTTDRPELALQTGHAQRVDGLAFSPDGRYFVSASPDSTVKIWDALNKRELRTLKAGVAQRAIAFSPDGRGIVAGGGDGRLRLWEAASGKLLAVFTGHAQRVESIAFSFDGQRLASGSADGEVRVWEVAAQSILFRLAAHKGGALAVSFSPDGRWLATGGVDRLVKLWDAATGEEVTAFGEQVNGFARSHRAAVKGLAFNRDGSALASGSADGVIKIWHVSQGTLLASPRALPGGIVALAFTRDGQRLSAGARDRTIKQFAAPAYSEVLTDVLSGEPDEYVAAAFGPDGEWLVFCNGSRAPGLRRVAPGGETYTFAETANSVNTVAFSPDGLWLASGHGNTTVTLWDLVAGRAVARLPLAGGKVNAVAFSPDSELLAAGGLGGGVKIWEVASGRETLGWQAHGALADARGVNALVFTPDGQRLISGGTDATIKVWDAASGALLHTHGDHKDEVTGLSLSPDGKLLASASADQTVKLWNLADSRLLNSLSGHQAAALAVVFSPDGKRLASGGADQTVIVWDVASGRIERTLSGSGGWVNCVAFGRAGNAGTLLLAAGDAGGQVRVWDAGDWREKFTLAEHTDQVRGLAFDPDNFWLVSGSEDGSARVWDAVGGQLAASLLALRTDGGDNEWLAATPDGLFDGSPAAWSRILWRFARDTFDAAPVEAFFNEFYYPDVLGDIFAGKQPRAKERIALRDRRLPQVELSAVEGSERDAGAGRRVATLRIRVAEESPDARHKTGSGARDVRLFRNGLLLKVWRGDVLKAAAAVPLEFRARLVAGENRFTAYAFNRDNVKSVDAAYTVNFTRAEPRRGTLYLLAVGIDRYANPDFNLKYAGSDARSFAAEVAGRQRQFARFARIEVCTLYDQDATKANLLEALRRLGGEPDPAVPPPLAALSVLGQAQPEDVVVFYFAGHGVAIEERFYLVPYDLGYSGRRRELDASAVQAVARRSVSDLEMETSLEGIDAGQLIFVLDACQSGQALEAEEERRGPMNSKGLAQLAYEKGMNILAAAQGDQAALETSRLKYGYLTYALVEEGIKRLAADVRPKDGQVLLREWLDYATERVPRLQQEKLAETRGLGLRVRPAADPSEAQRPRVFYRREAEASTLIIAKGNAGR